MPATIFGKPGPELGDQIVYEALKALPAACIVYAQPHIVARNKLPRHPDYVIVYHEWGVIVLEVKDWRVIYDRTATTAVVADGSKAREETSPVEQARSAAHTLASLLRSDPLLCNYSGGKLAFPYMYAGVLLYLPPSTISWLAKCWGDCMVLGSEDIRHERIVNSIGAIPTPFRSPMTEAEVRSVCVILDEANRCSDPHTSTFKGVYSREQEALAKEPLEPVQRVMTPAVTPVIGLQQSLDLDESAAENESVPSDTEIVTNEPIPEANAVPEELPTEVVDLAKSQGIRLVRGFAGTGKTDVLLWRARWLHRQHPGIRILVTTFNDLLFTHRLQPALKDLAPQVEVEKLDTLSAEVHKARYGGKWVMPQETLGLVAHMARRFPLMQELGVDFLAEEFIWMKETGRNTRERYLNSVRDGRGGNDGITLTRVMKERVYNLFEAYIAELQELPAHDWVDLHDKALRYLREGYRPRDPYDALLIDEGQHFAPAWLQIIFELLKPQGMLFICDDPSQSIYRYYSWRQKGLEVRGRTRWLRTPFRNTRQVFEAAYSLIADDTLARQLLAEEKQQAIPDVDHAHVRDGRMPEAHHFPTWEAERSFVRVKIEELIGRGIPPEDIAILHEKKHVLDRYRQELKNGVSILEVKKPTGIEYHTVFVPKVQEMLDPSSAGGLANYASRQRLKLYTAMCRARQDVYMLYEQRWPKELEALRPHVHWVEYTA